LDGEEAVVPVIWTGEEHLELEVFERSDESQVFSLHFAGTREGVGIHRVEFDEGIEVGHPLFQGDERMDFGAEYRDLLDLLLGAIFVIPEVGGAHGVFYFCEIFLKGW
jgi:hypothetical protein